VSRLTGDLSNVEQWKSTGSEADSESLQSRRHPGGYLLEYRVNPLVHADSKWTVVQRLLVEQRCKKQPVKLPQPKNYHQLKKLAPTAYGVV